MRELHKWEKDPGVRAAIEDLVCILIGDKPQEGMENLKAVDIPKEASWLLKIIEFGEALMFCITQGIGFFFWFIWMAHNQKNSLY